jgi:hypothetical protein
MGATKIRQTPREVTRPTVLWRSKRRWFVVGRVTDPAEMILGVSKDWQPKAARLARLGWKCRPSFFSKPWKISRKFFQTLENFAAVRGYAATEPHAEREDYFAPP